MSNQLEAADILDREFLEMRAAILSLAASFDRLDRAGGGVDSDPRSQRIQEGLHILLSPVGERAEKVQLAFSLPYEEGWPEKYGLDISQ